MSPPQPPDAGRYEAKVVNHVRRWPSASSLLQTQACGGSAGGGRRDGIGSGEAAAVEADRQARVIRSELGWAAGVRVNGKHGQVTWDEVGGTGGELAGVIDDGRWVPDGSSGGNILSGRHYFSRGARPLVNAFLDRGRGTVVCVDGHVEGFTPRQGTRPECFNPTF